LCFLLVRCRSLYERDEANVYAEPSVISECLLPYLLHLVKHYPESSTLTKSLEHWVRNTAAIVNENLTICMQLQLGMYSKIYLGLQLIINI